ncbi:MAG: NAD-glutamate dehydrogenase, partial [Rhodospirillales bacterium]
PLSAHCAFTCVGVGDMAGDVFGNGMLNSPVTKLVGAFNHMHIFLDPDPDVKSSYAERQRLFDLPRSSWTDYNSKLISKGGGIFERSAKSIRLSPEIRKLFDITETELAPSDLIRAMLKAKVDLLWFGGIGTYIKSSDESHTDAGDRANDALRVNGEDLRARVIGEGANLGTTQLGRIEAAMAGVRLNTDSIDNSAGVDCSDHEVNIKILLGGVVSDGDMTMKQRNKLLVEMTDEVGELVLRDNYLQSQAISLVEHGGVAGLHPQRQLMRMLERQGRLNRSIEYLPDDEELQDRQNQKIGLTRPEISILMPYAKIWLYDELLASDLPDDPQLEEDLVRYFPTALREKFREQIGGHRLRREIITTVVANSMINRVGGWFAAEIGERTGMGLVDIARAYTITRDV